MEGVREIRRTVLPRDVFELIEGYMMGEIKTLHIVAVSRKGTVVRVSTGAIPEYIAANDSSPAEIARALS
jgi:hypothetical protein